MLPDEVEQCGTVIEYMAVEPRGQMPSFEDRAVELSLKKTAGRRARSVRLRPGQRS